MCIRDSLSFTLPRNGIVGVIGPNGVGKTTLFKTIVGFEKPDAGEVKVGDTVKISYVDQARSGLDPAKTLWEVVSDGLDFIKVGQVEIPSRAYVSQFGFKGPDQQKPAGVLSGGERNRLNLAPVSYTHLDVYKRQGYSAAGRGPCRWSRRPLRWSGHWPDPLR